jgi:hypothetical protein
MQRRIASTHHLRLVICPVLECRVDGGEATAPRGCPPSEPKRQPAGAQRQRATGLQSGVRTPPANEGEHRQDGDQEQQGMDGNPAYDGEHEQKYGQC